MAGRFLTFVPPDRLSPKPLHALDPNLGGRLRQSSGNGLSPLSTVPPGARAWRIPLLPSIKTSAPFDGRAPAMAVGSGATMNVPLATSPRAPRPMPGSCFLSFPSRPHPERPGSASCLIILLTIGGFSSTLTAESPVPPRQPSATRHPFYYPREVSL